MWVISKPIFCLACMLVAGHYKQSFHSSFNWPGNAALHLCFHRTCSLPEIDISFRALTFIIRGNFLHNLRTSWLFRFWQFRLLKEYERTRLSLTRVLFCSLTQFYNASLYMLACLLREIPFPKVTMISILGLFSMEKIPPPRGDFIFKAWHLYSWFPICVISGKFPRCLFKVYLYFF